MKELKATNESQAKNEAIEISLENPGSYVIISACFGLIASIQKRLNVYAPSDSVFSWYVLNGTVKRFTIKQEIADQNATPVLY